MFLPRSWTERFILTGRYTYTMTTQKISYTLNRNGSWVVAQSITSPSIQGSGRTRQEAAKKLRQNLENSIKNGIHFTILEQSFIEVEV